MRGIRVIDQHLVEFGIGHIEKAVLVIDGQASRTCKTLADAALDACLGIEDQYTRRISLSATNRRSLSSIASPVIRPKRASTPFLISSRSFVSVSKMKMA